MKNYSLPYVSVFRLMKLACIGFFLIMAGGLNANTNTTSSDWEVLSFEEYESLGSEDCYLLYLENNLFGMDKIGVEPAEEDTGLLVPFTAAPDECPDIPYFVCDDFGPLVTNGIVYTGMIDKRKGSKPFCLIEGTDCFNLDGVNLHGRPSTDVFFDVYNFQWDPQDPEQGCEFNFYFTGHTNTKHVKAFLFRCVDNGGPMNDVICVGDTETMTSIPVSCGEGEERLPEFWTIVIAGLKWENYAFKIKPDSPCSSDEVSFLELEETPSGEKVGVIGGFLQGKGNNFVNCDRLASFEDPSYEGPEVEILQSSKEAEGCYDDVYPSTGCSTFQGEDDIVSFVVEGGVNEVELALTNLGSGEPLGMFLYDFVCGGQAIAFAEIRAGVNCIDTTFIRTSLPGGRYYLVVDSDATDNWGKYMIAARLKARNKADVRRDVRAVDVPPPAMEPDEAAIMMTCANGGGLLSDDPDMEHNVNIQIDEPDNNFVNGIPFSAFINEGNDGLPSDLRFEFGFTRPLGMDDDGNMVVDTVWYDENSKPWDPRNTTSFTFFPDDPSDDIKCGYIQNEVFETRIIAPAIDSTNSARILRADAVYPTPNDPFSAINRLNPPNEFGALREVQGLSRLSHINEFIAPPCLFDFFGVSPSNFDAIVAEGEARKVRIQSNREWRIIDVDQIPDWVILGEEAFSGKGDSFINFEVLPNDGEGERSGQIVLLGTGNLVDTISITQFAPESYNPGIEFSDFWIDCDAPRGKLTAIGCLDKPGITSEWTINSIRIIDSEEFGEPIERVVDTKTIDGGSVITTDLFVGINQILLTVEDALTGASTTIDTTLVIPSEGGPDVSCSIMEVKTCKGDLRYMVDLNIKNGMEPYEVEWSNGLTTTSVPELAAGWYVITVTDAKGCQVKKRLDIEPQKPDCPGGIIAEDQIVCADDNDPDVIYNVELPFGDDDPGNWNFSWRRSTDLCDDLYVPGSAKWEVIPGAKGESYDPGPLSETTYFKRFASREDGSGDIYPSNVVEVVIAPAVKVDLPRRIVVCEDDAVELSAAVSGGTPPYTFEWSNGFTGGATQTITAHSVEDYTVTVTDANGCTAGDVVRVSAKPDPRIAIEVQTVFGIPAVCVDAPITLAAVTSLGTRTPNWATTGSGSFDNTVGDVVTYTASADDLSSGEPITISATTSDIGNACGETTAEVSIEILAANNELCITLPEGFVSNNNDPQQQSLAASFGVEQGINTAQNSFNTDNLAATNNFDGVVLYQNKPNPFNNSTVIGFGIPAKSYWSLSVQNSVGQIIKTFDGIGDKGYNEVKFTNTDLAAGVYYYTLEVQDQKIVKKMVVLERK